MDSWRYMGKKFEVTKVECGWHWGVRDKIGKVKFCIICECHTVCYNKKYALYWASLVAQLVKNPAAMQETPLQFLGQEDPWRRDRLPTPVFLGFPGGSDGKESTCNAWELGSIPRLGTPIPWRRARQLTLVLLPGERPWTEEPGGLLSMGSQRARHD